MANIELGPLVSDIRGSIGGTTFGRARNGATARTKPMPPKSRTPYQSLARTNMAYIGYLWKTVSSADVADWVTYAATCNLYDSLGHLYHPTAYQAFVMCLMAQILTEISPLVLTRPTQDGLGTLQAPELYYSSNDIGGLTPIPPLVSPARCFFSVSTAYLATSNPSKRTFAQGYVTSATSWPYVMATDIDAAWASGLTLAARVTNLSIDIYGRPSGGAWTDTIQWDT